MEISKRRKKSLLIVIFIISSFLVNLPNDFWGLDESETQEDQNNLYKIQAEILQVMEDPTRQDDILEIFIMLKSGSQSFIDLPPSVSIMQRYSIIDALITNSLASLTASKPIRATGSSNTSIVVLLDS